MLINDVVFFLTILISFKPTQKTLSRTFEFKTSTLMVDLSSIS